MANILDATTDFESYLPEDEGQFIKPASDFAEALRDRLLGTDGTAGDPLPWNKTQGKVSLRPGELSVWAGINGHGKSLLLGQVMLWLLPDTRALIASLEMPPVATLERMARQASGISEPSTRWAGAFLNFSNDHLWIYDQLDSVKSDRILGMVHYAAQELDIKHVVIDSLAKCGISPDDYPGQKAFVDRLCWAAKRYGIHIHLVVHVRKKESESKRPDKFDIKGAGEITDLADNVLIVHRSKEKEKLIREGKEIKSDAPDATLSIEKQRHGEFEGTFGLYFHGPSQQFTCAAKAGAIPWPYPNAPRLLDQYASDDKAGDSNRA